MARSMTKEYIAHTFLTSFRDKIDYCIIYIHLIGQSVATEERCEIITLILFYS